MAKIWQKNVLSPFKNFQNWSRGHKDTSQKADFERDYMKLHSCHIMKKHGHKGLDWWYIGENWWKLAENDGNRRQPPETSGTDGNWRKLTETEFKGLLTPPMFPLVGHLQGKR